MTNVNENAVRIFWPPRDPVSAISHFIGFIFSIIGTIVLIIEGSRAGGALYVVAFAAFGVAMICLYLASTLYHWLNLGEKGTLILRKLDHVMIYIMIAGTYTPICLIALPGLWGKWLLISIWTLAIGGILLTLFWFKAPRWLTTGIYILMGWLVIVALVPMSRVFSPAGFFWLFAGGIFYTIGGIIYGLKKSFINLPGFGFHEVFHIFVLLGSIFHYFLMLLVVMKM